MTAPQGVRVGDGSAIWLLQREYDDTPRPPSVKIAGRLSDAYYWSVGWRLLLVLGAFAVLFSLHVEQVLGSDAAADRPRVLCAAVANQEVEVTR